MSEKRYEVSVLVPIYNVEKYIERCVVSLMEQSFESIQYVFVDDCGTDNSMIILQSVLEWYPSRMEDVLVIKHTCNKGLAAARNTALGNALGRYIYHVDSDDYIEINAISRMYEVAELNHCDLVFADYNDVYNSSVKPNHWTINLNKDEALKDMIFHRTPCHIWNVLIRRELYVNNGIQAVEDINNGEDYLVIIPLIFYSKVYSKLNDCLYNYVRFNQNSFQGNRNLERNRRDLLIGNEYLQSYFQKEHNLILYLSEYQYLLYVLYAINAIYIGDNISEMPLSKRWKFPNLTLKQCLICYLFNMKMYGVLLFLRRIRNL